MIPAPAARPDERFLFVVACACAGLLLGLLALPLLRGEIYIDSDLRRFYVPVRFYYQRALESGGQLLWFPYEFAGFYLHGEGQAGLYHPLNLLLYRWLPFTLAFNLEILRSYALGLLGAFLLLRRFELPASAALLGAIFFAFSGFQMLHYMHPNVVAAVAHLPWLLLLLDVMARGRPSRTTAAAAPAYALLTASQYLLGHPQALWMSLCVELLFAGWLAWNGAPRGALLRAGVAKGLGALAAAIQLLPTWETLKSSSRAEATADFKGSFALQLPDLAQLVQPYLFTERVFDDSATELGIYAGALGIFALAWLSFGRFASPLHAGLARCALVLGLIGAWLALGASAGLYTAVSALPVVGLFRAPARYILFLHVATALAAALCFAGLLQARAERSERALALALPLLSAGLAFAFLRYLGELTQGIAPAALGVALCAATAALVWIAAPGRTAALALLLVLASLDVGLYGVSYVRQRIPAPASLDDLLENVTANPDAARHPGYRTFFGPPEASILGARYLWGYVALYPKRELQVLPLDEKGRRLHPFEMGAWLAGMRVASVVREDVPDPLPRVRMLTDARLSTQPGVDIGAIDVDKTALVDRAASVDRGEPGAARIVSEQPGEIEIETRAAGQQLLVISESFHEGWKVWIDGEPDALLRAYGDFIGCVVPEGAHRIRLHFEPESFRQGARITGLALAAIAAWIAVTLARAPRAD